MLLVRKHYDTIKSIDFDAIVVAKSDCFGACSVNKIFIKQDGTVVYDTYDTIGNLVYFTSNISRHNFIKIRSRFKKADYEHLESRYNACITDMSTTHLTFIKEGKIIKSIYDYGQESPTELIWAYIPVVYLPDIIKAEPNKHKCFSLGYTTFIKDKLALHLTKSESFYLSYLLENASDVNKKINELYSLGFDNDSISRITTDGRYYKFYFKNKSTKTIDVGYDFLKESKLVNKFEKRNEQNNTTF